MTPRLSRLSRNAPAAAVLGLLCGLALSRCQVQLDPNGVYGCAADSDCGGGGYKCAPNAAGAKYCCLPSAEACDGTDNDCNGVVDDVAPASCFPFDAGTPGVGRCVAGQSVCGAACEGALGPLAEVCNQADDDCDGRADDGFDLLNDAAHCGQCNHACRAPDGGAAVCFDGGCIVANEVDCADGLDEDHDGFTDCADPDCNMQSCGAGCRCAGLKRTEIACADTVNNDLDDAGTDCADPDCNLQACGAGCECRAGVEAEANCGDGVNNDLDLAGADCADPDCDLQACGAGCECRAGVAAEASCGDGVNNDLDVAGADCADPDCDLQACGAGCECVGGIASELLCGDRVNNDRDDAGMDCVDPDCNLKACGAGCECRTGLAVETRCWDGANNDSDDAGMDCADPDCALPGVGCGADGGVDCLCVGGIAHERVCNDGIDNDNDTNADCRDTADCPVGTPCNTTGGTCQNNRSCK